MSNLLARAFALAETGKYSTVTQIRKELTKEGFSQFQLSQLSGKELTRKLRARIVAVRSGGHTSEG